jgi:AcrR family transcriptional regulator
MKKKVTKEKVLGKKKSNLGIKKTNYHHEDLREEILEESLKIIYESGITSLSLRDVARRLNVSHSAPYRHFEGKEDVLLALGIKGFKLFTEYLNRNLPLGSSKEEVIIRFEIMRKNYLEFSSDYNTLYHFMFGNNNLKSIQSPELQKWQEEAFSTLIRQIATMRALDLVGDFPVFETAFFCFVVMHGLSTMQNNGVMHHLSAHFSYDQNMQEKTMEFLLRSMESAITVTKDK